MPLKEDRWKLAQFPFPPSVLDFAINKSFSSHKVIRCNILALVENQVHLTCCLDLKLFQHSIVRIAKGDYVFTILIFTNSTCLEASRGSCQYNWRNSKSSSGPRLCRVHLPETPVRLHHETRQNLLPPSTDASHPPSLQTSLLLSVLHPAPARQIHHAILITAIVLRASGLTSSTSIQHTPLPSDSPSWLQRRGC